jgi:hypothetical protein
MSRLHDVSKVYVGAVRPALAEVGLELPRGSFAVLALP